MSNDRKFDVSNKSQTYPIPMSSKDTNQAKKARVSMRATKRVIGPYVKARQRPLATIKKREENKYFNFYLKQKPYILMRDLSAFISDSVDLLSVLTETGDVLRETLHAAGVAVYMVDEGLDEIYQILPDKNNSRTRLCWKIQQGTTVAAFVAFEKKYIMLDDVLQDGRFPDCLGYTDVTIKSVLCVPIVTPDDECMAVIELFRTTEMAPFQDKHLRLVIVVSGWVGSAIHQNQQRLALQRQQELNEYLLDLTKCYFADTLLLDKLIAEMVNFAKTALKAEHGSFYVIKKKYGDLMAECYEERIGTGVLHKKNVMIKIDNYEDIIGKVVSEKITINIKDATHDERIAAENKKRRDYITRSVLCMPIMGVDEILGIIKVVNKTRGACFSKIDEMLFSTFTTYCAFALYYNRLCENMSKTVNLNDIYIGLLAYHMQPCIHDLTSLTNNPDISTIPSGFNFFDWYIPEELEYLQPQLTMYMLKEISADSFVDTAQMAKFVLTVIKNYHQHPYHNFHHAFNVLHSMYNMLIRNIDVFTIIEMKALIVAALCHDIDHLGVTNNYLEIVNHSLAQLYEESLLENHHCHVTMFIIKDLNLFISPKVPAEMYKSILSEIRNAIMATDMSLYFKKRSVLYQICMDNSFSWSSEEHRMLLKSIMMTSADISGQCKPFVIAKKITANVYKEFYMEGDREKSMGFCPLSIMDRNKQNMVPRDQVQFLSIVVLPCTLLLAKVLPNCITLYKDAVKLRNAWQEITDSQGEKLWKQEYRPENKNFK